MLILTIDSYGYEIRRHIRHFKPFYSNTHHTDAFLLIPTLKNVLGWHLIVFFSEF